MTQVVEKALALASTAGRVAVFSDIGRQMAELHEISDELTFPQGIMRCAWDRDGSMGDAPPWDRFWLNPALEPDDRAPLLKYRDQHRSKMVPTEPNRLVAEFDAALVQKILRIPVQRRKPDIHHHRRVDDFRAGLEVTKWRRFAL